MIHQSRVNDVFNSLLSELKQDFFSVVNEKRHQEITYEEWITKFGIIFENNRSTKLPIRRHKKPFPDNPSNSLLIKELIEIYKEKVKYITITGASNVTGYINDIRKISGLIHKYGGKIIVDGAQLVPHKKICIYKKDSLENIDFLVFSGHKIYAPFGSGAIIGLREDFNNNLPDTKGGGTVEYVIDNNQLWLNTPEKNEAGTPNLFGAVAIMEAMKEIEKIGFERIEKNEKELLQYLINGLKELNRVKLYADNDCIDDRLGILVFTIDGMKYYEVGEKLSEIKAIGVRQGGFCSHPYTRRVLGIPNNQLQEYINKNGIPGLVRVSLGIYNSKKEANIFLETVELLCRRYAR